MTPLSDGWTPVRIGRRYGAPYLEWLRFNGRPYAEPFFEQTVEAVVREPFNTAFRAQTRLADLLTATTGDITRPAGLIFHMSHCGSTLVSQMLKCAGDTVVISESTLIDDVVWLDRRFGVDAEQHPRLLQAAAHVLGRAPTGGPLVLKLHAAHALRLPLFARAFPGVPWIFVHRTPVEVLVAQSALPGPELIAGVLPADAVGLPFEVAAAMTTEVYAAHVLAAICGSALVQREATGGGTFVDYAELPAAVASIVLPAFGIATTADSRVAMDATAGRDVKEPGRAFLADGEAKQKRATPELHRLAASLLEPLAARMRRAVVI